jgi:hypothetical protein
MDESSDSPDVQAFMVAFQKLRNMTGDAPEALGAKGVDNTALANLCISLSSAATTLRIAERSRRELYSAPTNPKFIAAWKDFNDRYFGPVSEMFIRLTFGEPAGGFRNDPDPDEIRGGVRVWLAACSIRAHARSARSRPNRALRGHRQGPERQN